VWEVRNEREGKSIGLAFFLVVAIKSNLSTFAAAKIRKVLDVRCVLAGFFERVEVFKTLLHRQRC
jgi:hypothetical protein